MNISRKKSYDYDSYGSIWKEIIWYGNLRYLNDIKIDLDTIKKLMDSDFKDLSDEEFYNLISRFYSIYITKDDILKILSKVNGIEYDKFEKLNSRMTFKDVVSEGHGKDFSYWEETFEIGWIVATAKNLTLNPEYNYSKKEIEQMIRNKQIICLDEQPIAIGMDPKLPYKAETPENVDIPKVNLDNADIDEFLDEYDSYINFNLLRTNDSEFSKEVYKTAFAIIRKRLNKKKVLSDCRQIILFLNNNFHLINKVLQNKSFDNETDKKKYIDLHEELTASHKSLSLTLTPRM